MADRKRPTKKTEPKKVAEKEIEVEVAETKEVSKDAEILTKEVVKEEEIKTYSGTSKIVEIAMQHCEFVWVNIAQPYIVHGKNYYPNGGWEPSEKEKEQFELMKNPFYKG